MFLAMEKYGDFRSFGKPVGYRSILAMYEK